MKGTTPAGTANEREAARWVRGMFGRVARRYDLLNHLLSFGRDRRWRARTAERLGEVVRRPGARVLDLCCGTGDLALALERAGGAGVMAADFCHPMLAAAAAKFIRSGSRSMLVAADALALPLAGGTLDCITAAFGFRNLANYRAGLDEMRRVLKPGGVAAILEFSQPPNPLFGALYSVYSRRLLPLVGGLISGSRDAYAYLPDSVRRFPNAEGLADAMREAGFTEVRFERLTLGVVALHLGWKAG